MMKQFLTFLLLLSVVSLFGQAPVNDDCDGLIDLGVAPACPENEIFTNVNATASDIGFGNSPSCFNGGTAQNDVWFSFVASDTIFDYTITVTGSDGGANGALSNPQIALYRGSCQVDGLSELACISADDGEAFVELDVLGLTPGLTYFIRINDYSATATPNWGDFTLCVDEMEPVNTIDEGGSTLCSGELYDSGGPDEDYGNDEDNTFVICPNQPNSCITFTLEYYNIEYSEFVITDQLIFYDGDTPDPGTIIGQIGGGGFLNGNNGGGGVCYQVQASSGCLTVQFISDGQVSFEGFAGAWECTTEPCDPADPLAVEPDITEEQIVDFISTPQTSVEITNITCPEPAYGLFQTTDNSELGLERGLLLTTGSLNWAVGPNNDPGGGNFNDNNGAPGDPDLDILSPNQLSNDACVIELDVFAATDELTFEYVFGSEEYPEFVNQFNDIFAFLISGPGIVGNPALNNQLNIAVLPDGNETPVEINSVNNQINWEYYRDNANGITTQYDGLTSDYLGIKKSLTARAQVQPCSTYHLKLAIADRGDFAYDSGVFISELRGGTPNLDIVFNSGIDYLIEDCTNSPDEIVVSLNSPQDEIVTYNVVLGGTAQLGLDYLLNLPSSITFLPGETEITFPISVISDLETEPIETITILLTNDFGCGVVNLSELVIELHDELVVEIEAGQDTAFACQDSTITLMVDGAATYFWTPPAIFEDPNSPNPAVTPQFSRWVTVEGNVGPCVDIDSIYIEVIDPVIEIEALDPTAICEGESVQLQVTDNVNNTGLTWTPEEGLDDPNGANVVASPLSSTEYIASVNLQGCFAYDTINIDVSPFTFPEMANDTTICENYSVQLAYLDDTTGVTTTYSWTPTIGVDNPTSATPIATPDNTTTYQLIATSANEACRDTADVTVTVLPADLAIQLPDTVEICLGESVEINGVTSIGTADGLVWSPDDGTLSDTTGLTVIAQPTISTTYLGTLVVGACTVYDSVFVRVDSLPVQDIMADPEKEFYCEGDIVTLVSPNYEPAFYPDIEFMWLDGPGYETGDSLWNMVLTAQDTFTYQRVVTNNACVDTAEIELFVVTSEEIFITPADTTICPGESVQLNLTYAGQGDISWEPESDLSCTDCFDPIANPTSTITYTAKAEKEDCVQEASATIIVVNPPDPSLSGNVEICAGDATTLSVVNPQGGVTYTWTAPGGLNEDGTQITVQPASNTTYTLTAVNECATVSEDLLVTVVEPADFSVEGVTICLGDPAVLTAIGTAPDGVTEVIRWFLPNDVVRFGETITINDLTETTDILVTYTYGDDCETIEQMITVEVLQIDFSILLTATPDLDSVMIFQGDEVSFNATILPDSISSAGFTYIWEVNGVVQEGEVLSMFTSNFTELGDNTVTVTAVTPEGCTDSQSITFEVKEPMYDIPNVFTPNGDDINDVFRVYNSGSIEIESFRVYNRWGNLVYEGSGEDAAWDGTYKDKPAPSEVYIYQILFNLGNASFEETGDVTLMR